MVILGKVDLYAPSSDGRRLAECGHQVEPNGGRRGVHDGPNGPIGRVCVQLKWFQIRAHLGQLVVVVANQAPLAGDHASDHVGQDWPVLLALLANGLQLGPFGEQNGAAELPELGRGLVVVAPNDLGQLLGQQTVGRLELLGPALGDALGGLDEGARRFALRLAADSLVEALPALDVGQHAAPQQRVAALAALADALEVFRLQRALPLELLHTLRGHQIGMGKGDC